MGPAQRGAAAGPCSCCASLSACPRNAKGPASLCLQGKQGLVRWPAREEYDHSRTSGTLPDKVQSSSATSTFCPSPTINRYDGQVSPLLSLLAAKRASDVLGACSFDGDRHGAPAPVPRPARVVFVSTAPLG